MFKNFVKISLRNLRKYKSYSFINIVGLAIAMAACMLVFLYVEDELSYDRFHKYADRIYRVVGDLDIKKNSPESAATGPPLGPALRAEIPSILEVVRITQKRDVLVQSDSRRFYENRVGYADASVFKVFSFPLVKGNVATALAAPYSIVLSETMAAKYFGMENPLGKVLRMDNEFEYQITGVMADMPRNSHFRFDFLASFESLRESYGNMYDCWWCRMAYTYLLLPEGVKLAEIENQFPAFIEKHLGPQSSTGMHLRLQPLTAIHLGSDLTWELEPGGERTYLYILTTVGFLILLVSCINYVNSIIARSSQRAKEICLRKIVGAKKTQLVGQFFGESIMMVFLALPIAITLVELFLPKFNALSAKTLHISYSGNGSIWIGLGAIAILVSIMAGGYPAMLLTRFHPTKVLKGVLIFNAHGGTFRGILVIVQFAFSVILIITTSVMFDQLNLIRTKKLGFTKQNIITIPVRDAAVYQNYEPFKSGLLANSGIQSLSAASRVPPDSPDDLDVWPADQKDSGRQKMKMVTAHYDFFETLGVELLEGRTFSGDFISDAKAGFVLNESAVKALGWKSAVDRRFGAAWRNKQGYVIGVVKDFHFESLYQKIEPTVFFMEPYYNHILVRIQTENVAETITFIKEKWQVLFPELPFEYHFLDERFDQLYQKEEKLGELFGYFSFLVILIACLGFFGLATFAAEQRTKEVGIRKVLGATVTNVVALLSKDFVKLVLLANVIAWPVAWYAMNRWLENFAYRIEIEWWVFALAGGLTLVIALLPVSTQAIRAALANPVESLRYE